MKSKSRSEPQLQKRSPEQPAGGSEAQAVPLLLPAVPPRAAIEGIRELAYRLYEQRGRADGHAVQDWLKAEVIIREKEKLAA